MIPPEPRILDSHELNCNPNDGFAPHLQIKKRAIMIPFMDLFISTILPVFFAYFLRIRHIIAYHRYPKSKMGIRLVKHLPYQKNNKT